MISLDSTPLGPDVLLLDALSGEEALSELFEFRLDLLSTDQGIKAEDIVGKAVLFSLRRPDGSRRPFSGVVRRFIGGPLHMRSLRRYHAEVVPWLWFLTRTSDCRVFQEKTAVEIAEEIFDELGFTDFDTAKIQENHRKREYCVQYRETDFDFLSRLWEEEGIFYWFTHADDGKHVLHLADRKDAHETGPLKEVELTEGSRSVDYLDSWQHVYEFRAGKWAQTDYNFEKPGANLTTAEETVVPVAGFKSFEHFDYPGLYEEKADGDGLTRVRMEAEEWPYSVVEASSQSRGLLIGHKFTLTRHYDAGEKGDYVLTRVRHEASNASYVTGLGGTEDYTMSFHCIPADTVFRPPRRTPRPRIHGLQTAVCVGRKGEEIDTDKYGRIKCQFYWDRRGKHDDKSSCWIRVAHPIAGKKWGTADLPRLGQEVVVAFLEGDPDRPLVLGSVFNDWTMPPYDLPAHKTRWTTKTMSSKGGGGFNELRFEDKKGEEQVFIHAERNQDNRVKNDSLEWVGNNRHLIVKADQLEKVEGDKHLSVTGDHNEKVSGTISVQADMDMQEKAGMKHALDAGMEIHLKAGMNVIIEAGMSITLKAGGGFIVVGPAGVTISGTPVLINSGGAAGSGSGSSPQAPQEPELADQAEPGEKVEMPPPVTPPAATPMDMGAVQAQTLREAAATGTPFCEKCEAARQAAAAQQSS